MDAIRSSRKRNHPPSSPSHPLYGRLTRSRSQIFRHRSRSGLLRPDPRRPHEPCAAELPPLRRVTKKNRSLESNGGQEDGGEMVLARVLCKKTKLNQEASSTCDDDELARVLMKDLRARRVYSPQSSAAACSGLVTNVFSKGSDVDSDCGDRRNPNLGFGPKPSAEISGCEKEGSKMEVMSANSEKVFSCEGQNKDDVNSVLRLILNEYRSDKDSDMYVDDVSETSDLGISPKYTIFDLGNPESPDEKCKLQDEKQSDGISSDKINDSTEEEWVQTTPRDAESRLYSDVKGDEGKRVEEEVPVNDTPLAGNALEIATDGFCPEVSQRNDTVLKSESAVLRPRLQEKLFKAPGSVSFGRMFSFLMGIGGDDSGTPNLGHCQKDEKGVNVQESQLPLSSISQEASKHELQTDSCPVHDTRSGVFDDDAVVAPVNELSNGHDKSLSESKADSTVDFPCVKEVGNALLNEDLKQGPEHNNDPDYAKANTFEKFDVFNEECVLTTPPDADICDKAEVNKVDQLESDHPDMCSVKAMDKSRSIHEIAGEGSCLKIDKRKDSTLKSKSVPRSNLHRKLFRNPGSVSYKRLLPFIMNFTKHEHGHQSCHKKAEADMHAKRFQLPLPSQSQDASVDVHKIDSGPVHGTVESNALVDSILVDPTNEFSCGNQSKLTSSQDLPGLPVRLDAKEMVHESFSTKEIVHESLSAKEMVDFHCDDNVANALHCDGLKQVQNKISMEYNSESPPKAQNVLYVNGNVSNLTPELHSCKQKGPYIDYGERKQVSSLEKCESVSIYRPEGQSLNNLDTIMPDAEDNGKRSHAICRGDDAVVLNHVSVSNEEPRPSPKKFILEKSDTAGRGHRARYVLKGKVYGPRMPTKRSNNKSVNCIGEIGNSPESKTTLVINSCSQNKLLKHAGSLNYKRLLPYVSNTMKNNSCAFPNDHCPKVQKCLDQTPILQLPASDMGVTPIRDSNGCVPMEHCGGSAGTLQQTGVRFRDLNSDRSSPISKVPESKALHDSCKVGQPHHEFVVFNQRHKLESSSDPRTPDHRIELPVSPLGAIVNEATSFPTCSNGEKAPETHDQSLSQVAVLEQPRVSAIGFKKGILKRTPRGCRGLCTCLNCASFRLHAERAFEFSRNQFLDTEEVAQDLMKELSHLRKILERSTDSVSDNPVFDQSQVKEACKKALDSEQVAKDRLSQINDDLDIHCRLSNLQRPRVRFADHVEEKIIQPDR